MSKIKQLIFIAFSLLWNMPEFCSAQVLCIQCYDQDNPVSPNVTNSILNGGFESTNCMPDSVVASTNCPNSLNYNCNVDYWVCTGGGPNTYTGIFDSLATSIIEGNYAFYFGNDFCNVCSPTLGDTACLTSFGCTVSGVPAGYPYSGPQFGNASGVSIHQTVNGLVPGSVYVLEFWCGGEAYQNSGLFAVNVGYGDTLLRCTQTPAGYTGKRYIIQFVADSVNHTISFTNWGHICPTCTELILDDVKVYPIAQLSSIVPTCAVGIPQQESDDVTFYYDSFNERLKIHSLANEKYRLNIFDSGGRNIMTTHFTGDLYTPLPLPIGIYFYTISTQYRLFHGKFNSF